MAEQIYLAPLTSGVLFKKRWVNLQFPFDICPNREAKELLHDVRYNIAEIQAMRSVNQTSAISSKLSQRTGRRDNRKNPVICKLSVESRCDNPNQINQNIQMFCKSQYYTDFKNIGPYDLLMGLFWFSAFLLAKAPARSRGSIR